MAWESRSRLRNVPYLPGRPGCWIVIELLSRADFVFCMIAITWGWSADEAADRLMEESAKAQTAGRSYAELTARNAGLAVERRRQQPKQHRGNG